MKLLLKKDIGLAPGYEVLCETACMIKDGLPDFCLHIQNENILLTLLSEGYICELFSGKVNCLSALLKL